MGFDIGEYTTTAHRVQSDDVDYDSFAERPLSRSALRCLRYMSDVESHTICYLRDLLVTPSHKDPEVTAFLTMWAYEEFWHGEALDEVLRAHDVTADYGHIRKVRLAQGFRDRLAPIEQSLAANIIGDDFVAVHMTWGAINEWSAHAAYARMIEREDHPELTKLLRRVQYQESRHLAFYNSQARAAGAFRARSQAHPVRAASALGTGRLDDPAQGRDPVRARLPDGRPGRRQAPRAPGPQDRHLARPGRPGAGVDRGRQVRDRAQGRPAATTAPRVARPVAARQAGARVRASGGVLVASR